MKVFHVVFSDPIGPSWIAYIEPPTLNHHPEHMLIKTWLEETELSVLMKNFADHVIMSREMPGTEPFNCMLEIRAA